MRVVLATHRTNQWLGVNKYFYLLGKYLARLGVDVTIVVDSLKGYGAVREICGDSVKIVRLSPTASNQLSTLRYCYNLSCYLARHPDFDVFHCGHILPFFYLMRKQHKPVVFQPFGNELFTLAGKGMNRLYCRLAQPILRFCGEHSDVILAEGAFQYADMAMYYPKAQRITVLPVGVDIDSIRPKSNYTTDKRFQFLAVNSLLPYEGMDDLIGAFRTLNGDCNSLVIVGIGSEEDKLKEMARGLRVVFKKNLPENELKALYMTSDAFICATYETDFQMGVLEAMASGLPVLCREADWLPSSVIHFYADSADLIEKLAWLASTSVFKRLEMGNRGLEDVQQYSFTDIAAKALKIYSKVLGEEV